MRGNFSNPSDPPGGRQGWQTGDAPGRCCVCACTRENDGERGEKKKNKIEETFCVIGKRSKRVFALV